MKKIPDRLRSRVKIFRPLATVVPQRPHHTERPMYDDCPTCKLLWEELSESTKAHVVILAKFQLAQIQQNNAVLVELEPLIVAAAERRDKARTAFKENSATHEIGNAKAQMA